MLILYPLLLVLVASYTISEPTKHAEEILKVINGNMYAILGFGSSNSSPLENLSRSTKNHQYLIAVKHADAYSKQRGIYGKEQSYNEIRDSTNTFINLLDKDVSLRSRDIKTIRKVIDNFNKTIPGEANIPEIKLCNLKEKKKNNNIFTLCFTGREDKENSLTTYDPPPPYTEKI